jgi:hypothetical protein
MQDKINVFKIEKYCISKMKLTTQQNGSLFERVIPKKQ